MSLRAMQGYDPANPNNGPLAAESLTIATVTWANLPAASSNTGKIFRVSDVANGLFISDGTYWVPVNGHLILDSRTNLELSTTSTALAEILGWSLLLPANLWRKPGSMLRGMISGTRTGTLNTAGYPGIRIAWSNAENMAVVTANNNNQDAYRGMGAVMRVNDTQIRANSTAGVGGEWGTGGGDLYESTVQTLTATADTTLKLFGNVSITPGAGETITVDQVMVELITP